MLKYESTDLGELAHQLTLSPRRLRFQQLDGIESLLAMADAGRAYPYELVCFTITGFRPRAKEPRPSIPGHKLIADLVTMAEHVSRKARLTVTELPEPYQSHEALAEELRVSTKTVRRWRRRGLAGIRVECEDGVNRMMFLRKTVLRFVKQNEGLVSRGAAFTQLSEVEKRRIIDLAAQILSERRMKLHVVARRIAAETGRAVETVRYTLRRHDQAHPGEALFANDGQPVASERHRAIWRCNQAGDSAMDIAASLGCAPAEIEGVIREFTARALLESPPDCVYNELFDAPNADALILDVPEPAVLECLKKPRAPRELPAYLRALYDIPLLSQPQEHDRFRRYNYLKFKASRLVKSLQPLRVTAGELAEISGLLEQAAAWKKALISANLRLVVSIAKKHVGWSDNFFEAVSDGNLSLMRAVEKFDYARGNKFSTYASWAIMKNFARTIPEDHYHCRRFVTGQDQFLGATADPHAAGAPQPDLEGVRAMLAAGMDRLTDREREIVTDHYGLFGRGPSQTLEQLGRKFGVTKERIRQIERRAIDKIRLCLAPAAVDALAD